MGDRDGWRKQMAPWRGGLADCGQLALALATIKEDSTVNTACVPPLVSVICSFRLLD